MNRAIAWICRNTTEEILAGYSPLWGPLVVRVRAIAR